MWYSTDTKSLLWGRLATPLGRLNFWKNAPQKHIGAKYLGFFDFYGIVSICAPNWYCVVFHIIFGSPDPGTLIIRSGSQLCRMCSRSCAKLSNDRIYGAGNGCEGQNWYWRGEPLRRAQGAGRLCVCPDSLKHVFAVSIFIYFQSIGVIRLLAIFLPSCNLVA